MGIDHFERLGVAYLFVFRFDLVWFWPGLVLVLGWGAGRALRCVALPTGAHILGHVLVLG